MQIHKKIDWFSFLLKNNSNKYLAIDVKKIKSNDYFFVGCRTWQQYVFQNYKLI